MGRTLVKGSDKVKPTTSRWTGFEALSRICTRVPGKSPFPFAHWRKSCICLGGKITQKEPDGARSWLALCKSSSKDKLWVWRAWFLLGSLAGRWSGKKGGLLTSRSKRFSSLKSWNRPCITVNRSEKGLCSQFSAAWLAAFGSSSTAVRLAWGKRWASIRAMTPVPVPMSRICLGASLCTKLLTRTASVLIFIAQRSCSTRNCWNWNQLLPTRYGPGWRGECGIEACRPWYWSRPQTRASHFLWYKRPFHPFVLPGR